MFVFRRCICGVVIKAYVPLTILNVVVPNLKIIFRNAGVHFLL